MKITEIISPQLNEDVPGADGKKLPHDHMASIKGALSLPSISMNKSNGSSYMQYRFGIALAGAPDFPTDPAGAFSGDPFASTYTNAEREMIDYALQQVGGGSPTEMSDNLSRETDETHKVSPHRTVGPITLIVSKKK